MSNLINGKRILITGASGLFGRPLSHALNGRNEIFALARYSDPKVRDEFEKAGIKVITADLATLDPGSLPEVDYVVHAGAILASTGSEKNREQTFETNVQATGRLMRRYARVKGFLYCGSGSCYAYQGQRPLKESDPFGLHNGIETYAASKIAAESLVSFLCKDQGTPSVIIRIFTMYGKNAGTITRRIDMVAEGKTVPVYPDGENHMNPLYVGDGVRMCEKALTLAAVPATIVNFAGSETMSVQEFCGYAGELVGKQAQFREDPKAYYPIWPDVTKMHELLGRAEVGVKEGVRLILEYGREHSRDRKNWLPGAQ
jgi:nucleoside-diphosphate-sugar epimerase